MIEPATMIIRETDEEPTLVDRARLAGPEPAFEGSGDATPAQSPNVPAEPPRQETLLRWQAASALLSSHRRQIIEIGGALTVLFGLGLVAYQQWRVADALRETLAEMQAPRQAMVALRSGELPQIEEMPDRAELQRKAFTREVGAIERGALERQAAALIASNDFRAALSQYEMLAELFPGDGTFRNIVKVLRAKLRCERSTQSASIPCP